MVRRLIPILVLFSSVPFWASPSQADEWTLALRSGYGWSMLDAQTASGFYIGGEASRSLGTGGAVVGSLGYLGWTLQAYRVCPAVTADLGGCGPDFTSSTVIPVGLGLRLGGGSPHGSLLPYFEVVPTLFLGRWVTGGNSSERAFAGFQVASGVPVRLTQRWHCDVGFLYIQSEDVMDMQGIRSFHLLGSLVYHL